MQETKSTGKASKTMDKTQCKKKAKMHFDKGQYTDAITYYDAALSMDPKDASIWQSRGISKFRLNQYEEGLQDLEEAIKLDPKSPLAFTFCGQVKLKLGNSEQALKDFDEAIKLDRKNPLALAFRGELMLTLGRYEDAVRDLDEAIKLDRKNENAFVNRGIAKFKLGQHEESVKDMDKAIKLNSKNPIPWSWRGAAKTELGKLPEAMQNLDEAIRLEPKLALAWANRGEVKRQYGNYKEAILDCDQAILLDPNEISGWWTRGSAKREIDFFEESIQDFDEAIKIDPKSAWSWTGRGQAYMRLERYDEAILDFSESNKLKPSKYVQQHLDGAKQRARDAWQEWSRANYDKGLYAQAITYCEKLLEFNPQNVSALQLLGESKLKLGRCEDAIKFFMEVIKLSPNDSYAKECLKEARRKLKEEAPVSMSAPSRPQLQENPVLSAPSVPSPVFGQTIKASMAISKDQLIFEKKLGEGSFGEVHRGVWSPTSLFKIPVAIKQLKNASMSTKVLEDFKREVEVQAQLDSSGVVKLFGITSEQPYCMVMEFMEQGSLRDVLDSQAAEELHWDIRLQMAGNMARGLAYLHGNDPIIIHGDLKSLNILVNAKGEAKLADFGLAALKTESRSKEYVSGNADKNKGPKGSLLWIAPELFRMNAKRTTATDIFSFAVVLWELASHLFPYESAQGDSHRIQDWVEKGERESFDERTPNTPKEYSDLTQRCWDGKPENRLSAGDIVVELEKLYSNTSLAPTLFSSSSKLSPTPPRRQSMNSGGYMANTGSGPVPVKSSSGYLVKSVAPSLQSPTASPKVPPRRPATGSSGFLAKSTTPSPTASPQVPPKSSPYVGNVYK